MESKDLNKKDIENNSNIEEEKQVENNDSQEEVKADVKKTSKKWLSSKKDKKIKELEEKVEELKNDYLRSRADFDNYRKRKEKEVIQTRERAVSSFVIDLLPSIDNFEMSLKMTDNKEMFIKGVEMIHKNLIDTLKANKFEEFVPNEGDDFDPYMHDPVLIEDNTKEPGKVVAVLRKGFLHKENVLRPARVQVVKEKESQPVEEDSKKEE